MNPRQHPDLGMDVVVIVCSNETHQIFWQRVLDERKGDALKDGAIGIAITENGWKGNAGNGLGTLFAYQQARQEVKKRHGFDLDLLQASNKSIAMIHTAGMGTRLFPLVGAEHNNKSAVRLPFGHSTMTLLEAIMRQTRIFAPSRGGRLSVFWGDQLFIPSISPLREENTSIELFATLILNPTEKQWNERNLSSYGIVVCRNSQEAQLLDKVAYASVPQSPEQQVGISLGAFSLSWSFLKELLKEFSQELHEKTAKLDTDPHFWMALTLNESDYLELMQPKGWNKSRTLTHYHRMQAFKERFLRSQQHQILFSVTDIGPFSYWWDYGSTQAYFNNVRKLIGRDSEAELMRTFFQLDAPSPIVSSELLVDHSSILRDCRIRSGSITNSVVVGVTADSVEIKDSVVLNCQAEILRSEQALAYHAFEAGTLILKPGSVRADAILSGHREPIPMTSHLDRNGKDDWMKRLDGNSLSYAELWQKVEEDK